MGSPPLARFVLLYAAMYAAYGAASPFLPALVGERGVSAAELGFVLGAGTALRLLTIPVAGRLGDRLRSLRLVLTLCIAGASVATLGYLGAHGLWAFLALAAVLAATLGPMGTLADALALESAKPRSAQGFEYGWVRGTGSAAFIAGTLASGQAIAALGLAAVPWLQSALLVAAAIAAFRLPEPAARVAAPAPRFALGVLRIREFRVVVIVAALVLGSHAMHDAFAVIRWREAGIGAGMISALWSEAVAAEVAVFFLAGPALVSRLTPAGAIALAALAGVVRWGVMAQSASAPVAALVQPLHGLTFALLHLACMRIIARSVPAGQEGTAQALYATVGAGAATAALTFAAGGLYGRLGPQAFWVMAALCAAALPFAFLLRKPQ